VTARRVGTAIVLVLWIATRFPTPHAQTQARPIAVAATRDGDGSLRTFDAQVDQMLRTRDLRVREALRDADLPERRHERLDQYYRGVRIVGGDLTRQLASDGTVSLFGMLHSGIDIDTTPRLTAGAARTAINNAVGGEPVGPPVELVILPLSDGYHLAYRGQAFDGSQIFNVAIDANSAAVLRKHSEFITEVGKGKGTYGDDKKVSTKSVSGTFVADDGLRPSAITTFDMKGSLSRTNSVLNRFTVLGTSDMASDADNDWTDPTVVDAHVYAGWYYDYLFKRFGRHGIDDRELRIQVLTHPVNRADIFFQPPGVVGLFYLNAFFCPSCGTDGRGTVLFGEGAPINFVGPGIEVKPFSAAFDVVAHELTHAVTAASANLNSFELSEAGALNEAFSDMFGVGAAFFFFPPGSTSLMANYVVGKDLSVPTGTFAIRNLANPAATRNPDHYSGRVIGGDEHFNATIPGHAYFLAIEGGTNRTSGRTVQGVGPNNRDQIEKAFFRALTVLLPSSATFALTRAATIQAARDLFGANSAAERAITQAWDAVGVTDRTLPTVALGPNPNQGENDTCSQPGLPQPNWLVAATVSAGTSNLRVTNWTLNLFDAAGGSVTTSMVASNGRFTSGTPNSAAQFAQAFIECGPGSQSVAAQTDACSYFCVSLGGEQSGGAQFILNAADGAGQTVTATSTRITLAAPR
jgi:Zn-dependent metalloprotease